MQQFTLQHEPISYQRVHLIFSALKSTSLSNILARHSSTTASLSTQTLLAPTSSPPSPLVRQNYFCLPMFPLVTFPLSSIPRKSSRVPLNHAGHLPPHQGWSEAHLDSLLHNGRGGLLLTLKEMMIKFRQKFRQYFNKIQCDLIKH